MGVGRAGEWKGLGSSAYGAGQELKERVRDSSSVASLVARQHKF